MAQKRPKGFPTAKAIKIENMCMLVKMLIEIELQALAHTHTHTGFPFGKDLEMDWYVHNLS